MPMDYSFMYKLNIFTKKSSPYAGKPIVLKVVVVQLNYNAKRGICSLYNLFQLGIRFMVYQAVFEHQS